MVLETIELLSIKVKKLKKENRKLQKENKALNKELETYKKIAEKLAIGCKQLFKECPLYCEEVCEERKENKKTCVECLIEYARSEVNEECISQKKNILNN